MIEMMNAADFPLAARSAMMSNTDARDPVAMTPAQTIHEFMSQYDCQRWH